MRKGGGKQKGGAFENVIARKIAKAFVKFNITEDDCYRTKNSGATKAQPGDLQMSPALAKLLPALIEAKHYKKIEYKLGKFLSAQPESYIIRKWWKQVKREERDHARADKFKMQAPKFGLLVMRQNNVPDICAFSPQKLKSAFEARHCDHPHLTRYTFKNLIITYFRDEEVWIVPLADFLTHYTLRYKWFTLSGVIK